ncbi:hypothetical protein VZT92_022788 [Zoarces viviparus]
MFNLDRFRFDKKATTIIDLDQDNGSQSPESEKENKPAQMKLVKATPKSHARGVVFEEVITIDLEEDITIDLEEDELLSETNTKTALTSKSKCPTGKSSQNMALDHTDEDEDDDDDDMDEKMNTILEMFPQLTRTEVLEVIGSTSTMECAVAACLLKFGNKEAPDQGRKRKQDGSSSSQYSGEVQTSKRTKTTVVSVEDDGEPSWEKQEGMVRRLQKKFPDQDKEELRLMLQEHGWNVMDALLVLQMFSDPDDTSVSSPDTEENQSSKSKSKDESSQVRRKSKHHKDHRDSKRRRNEQDHIVISETEEESEDDTDATNDSDDSDSGHSGGAEIRSSTSTLSTWLTKSSDSVSSSSSVKKTTTSSSLKPASSSSTAQILSRFASGTSIAMKQAAERKRKARASDERVSSEEEDDEEAVSSEFEESDEELDSKGGMTDLKKEMLNFFRDSSIDELSLIAGCSFKKAQKIVELRPFDGWQSLVDVLIKANGLSDSLLLGCRVVLKERKVVLGLMSKCNTISSKMVKQVTEVMERGTRAMKQPGLLNSQ